MERPRVVVQIRPADVFIVAGIGALAYVIYKAYRWLEEHVPSEEEIKEAVRRQLAGGEGAEIVLPDGTKIFIPLEELRAYGGLDAYCHEAWGGDWFGFAEKVPEGYRVLWTSEIPWPFAGYPKARVPVACASK